MVIRTTGMAARRGTLGTPPRRASCISYTIIMSIIISMHFNHTIIMYHIHRIYYAYPANRFKLRRASPRTPSSLQIRLDRKTCTSLQTPLDHQTFMSAACVSRNSRQRAARSTKRCCKRSMTKNSTRDVAAVNA